MWPTTCTGSCCCELPDRTRRFLRRTAVLDQLCGGLREAVVGEPGGQEELRRLEASSLFLVPLDRRREWYRYHGLFREFLLGELRRVEPDVTAKLHLRAADWYEANGSRALALEHLLNTGEQDRCVQLVTALAVSTFYAGQISTVQRWLTALGDPAIEASPPLAVLAGWIAAMTGRAVEAQRWLAILDTATYDLVPGDGSASFDSARAMLRAFLCTAGPEQMMADASFAVDQEPPWGAFRDTAVCLSAEAHLLTGDVDRAAALFAEANRGRHQPGPGFARRRGRAGCRGDGSRPMDAGGRARRDGPRCHRFTSDARLPRRVCSRSPRRPGWPFTRAT